MTTQTISRNDVVAFIEQIESDIENGWEAQVFELKLARYVLTAMDIEPVGYFGRFDVDDEDLIDQCSSNIKGAFPLYAAPPAPVAVPDEAYSDDCPDLYPSQPDAWAAGWNACRAAMQAEPGTAATVPGWIKCSERMPNDGEYVIVATDNTVWVETHFVEYDHDTDQLMWFSANAESDLKHVMAFSHWMPLPAAPEQEA